MQQCTNQHDIRHSVGTPYHPAGQGIVERRNSEVKRHLKALALEFDGLWDEHVSRATDILNNMPFSTTNVAPYQLLFGRTLKLDETLPSMAFQARLKALQDAHGALLQKACPTTSHRDYAGQAVLLIRQTAVKPVTRGPLRVLGASSRPNVYQVRDFTTKTTFDAHADSLHLLKGNYTDAELAHWAARMQEEYVVERIVQHRTVGEDVELEVHWLGYDDADDSWLKYDKDTDKLEALDTYVSTLPELRRQLSAIKRRWRSRQRK